jgi:hypothetical protein
VVVGWGVDADEGRTPVGEPLERVLASLVAYPASIAQLERDAVRGERLDQAIELVQLMLPRRERGGQLHEVATELAGLGQRTRLLDQPLGQSALQIGREAHAAAARGLGSVA